MEFGEPPESSSDEDDEIGEAQKCGPSDERMSWGLQFYEQQDMVNRAHFPDVYGISKKSGRKSDANSKDAGAVTDEVKKPGAPAQQPGLSIDVPANKDIVDWKYQPPSKLS